MSSTAIIDITEQDFADQVITASATMPVLVDFWADWCAPCKMLSPLLEKLADDYAGKLRIVKVNTDSEQNLATEHGIRSLPTVRLYKDGEVVREFMGVQPESVIRSIVDQYVERESDTLRLQAESALEQGNHSLALTLLEQARNMDRDNPRLLMTLAAALIQAGRGTEVAAVLDQLPPDLSHDEQATRLRALAEFENIVHDAAGIDELTRRITATPDDLDARHQLGVLLVMNEDYTAGMDQFLEILKRDRKFRDDLGRRRLLDVFKLLDANAPLVNEYRRKMSALLN